MALLRFLSSRRRSRSTHRNSPRTASVPRGGPVPGTHQLHCAQRATHWITGFDGENLRGGSVTEAGADGMQTFKKLLLLLSCAA